MTLAYTALLLACCCSCSSLAVERIFITAPSYSQQWVSSLGASWWRPIDNSASNQLTDLLQTLPGVQADARTSAAQDSKISIRGFGSRSAFGSRGIEFLIDGIPQSTPDGQLQLNGLLLDDVSHIEVLTGPMASAVSHGAGGVIAVHNNALTDGSALEIQQQQGDSQRLYRLRLHQAGWTAAWQERTDDGFRPHQRSVRQQANVRHQTDLDDEWQWTQRLDWMRDPLLQDPLGLTPLEWQQDPQQTSPNAMLFDSRKTARQWSVSSALTSDTQRFALWRQQRAIEQYQAQTGQALTSAGGVVQLQRVSSGLDALWQLPWPQWPNVLAWHSDINLHAEQSAERRYGFVNDAGRKADLRRDEAADVTSLGFTLTHTWQCSTHGQLSVSHYGQQLRYRIQDYFVQGNNPDDSGAVRYQEQGYAIAWQWLPSFDQQLQLAYGEGFEAPTLADITYQATQTGPNLTLRPARNQQWQWQWRQQSQQWHYQVSLYHIQVRDELAIFQSNAGRTVYYNALKTRRRGVELAWSYQTSQHKLTLALSSARPLFAQGEYQGNLLPGSTPRQAQLEWQWQPLQRWRYGITLAASSRTAADDANLYVAAGHVTTSLSAHYQFTPAWQGYVTISNATNQSYATTLLVNAQNNRWIEPSQPRLYSAGILGRIELE